MFVKTFESAPQDVTHVHVVRYNDTDKTGIEFLTVDGIRALGRKEDETELPEQLATTVLTFACENRSENSTEKGRERRRRDCRCDE